MHEGNYDVRNVEEALAANRELDRRIGKSAAVISLRPTTGVVWRRLDDSTDF